MSVVEYRKTARYRILESLLGILSISFICIIILLSFFNPTLASIILIVYSFMWLMKYTLNIIYTVYTFKRVKRWEDLNIENIVDLLKTDRKKAIKLIDDFAHLHKDKIEWFNQINDFKVELEKNGGTKFSSPENVKHVCNFAVYNEPKEVLRKSLEFVYNTGYALENIMVVISQEQRAGVEHNQSIRDYFADLDWVNSHFFATDAKFVNTDFNNLDVGSDKLKSLQMSKTKINLVFTEHPDGMVGEIKGKASNEDWGARQASVIAKGKNWDKDLIIVTSLDADSHLTKGFFHNLSFTYCANKNRAKSGYQPVHSYSSNFFQTSLWPRQVAMQTTLSNMTNQGIDGETPFFAIYSVPMRVLWDVDFWVKDVIGEDGMFFAKCLIKYGDDFKVIPFYGVFEGDAIIADTFMEGVIDQYKQLQRWAWGGVETFPYLVQKFFFEKEGRNVDIKIRLRWLYLIFSNHFFWSSSPLLFSVGLFLPQVLGGSGFRELPISQNLASFSQYFAWISFVYIVCFGYISYVYLARNANKGKKLSLGQSFVTILQFLISPFLYGLMGIPALDAQIRGITANYLGYWVTPKR